MRRFAYGAGVVLVLAFSACCVLAWTLPVDAP